MSAHPGRRERLHGLLHGTSPAAQRLQWAMLATDVALITFFLVTTFVGRGTWLIVTDYAIGTVMLIELLTRLWVARDRTGFLTQPLTVLDIAVVLSLLAPSVTENFIFLRVLRTLRLLRSYRMLMQLRSHYAFFARNEQVIFSATNLLVFIFIVSAAVYALQVRVNSEISNYLDALYFTVTTLTTTGFGDITMVGNAGRMLAVLIMIVGVSLFLRLIQAIFRPPRISYECPDCGLTRHDPDAIHCKHCGRLLHIRTPGSDG